MDSYGLLAESYDRLTRDVDYAAWADYLEQHFQTAELPVKTVLDLACGTGSMTRALALRGYEMIAADQSGDMLAQAAEKCRDLAGEAPIFLCQEMDGLDLYGTIDACVCCLDSVNYVTDPAALSEAFRRVHLFLMPGGVFIFDVRPPEHLESLDGQVFLDETEDVYCVWRAEYHRAERLCTYGMDLFCRTGAVWRRDGEVHEQYAYTLAELEALLQRAGFTQIKQYGGQSMKPPGKEAERVFFAARKDSPVHGR